MQHALRRVCFAGGRPTCLTRLLPLGVLVGSCQPLAYGAPFVPCRYTSTAALDVGMEVRQLMEDFGEARELISDAHESIGTTYYSEDMEDAIAKTKETMERWHALLQNVEGSGQMDVHQSLQNELGLKFKQLEQELETVKEAGGAD